MGNHDLEAYDLGVDRKMPRGKIDREFIEKYAEPYPGAGANDSPLIRMRRFTRPTVYVAGPMRGYKDLNYPAFEKVAKEWRAAGWQVISPAEEDLNRGEKWTEESVEKAYANHDTPWVRHDVEIIMALQPGRDGVVALPGWQNSKGATAEIRLAEWRGIRIYVGTDPAVPPQPVLYDPREQDTILAVFNEMLRSVTKDGGRKRAAGTKPPWYKDNSHEAAIFSHLMKWKKGSRKDEDSGAHPLVHLAWRALAIAYRETHGDAEPTKV